MQTQLAVTPEVASRAAELRARSRTAATDLLKTVVSLATGAIAVIFAMMTDKDTVIGPGAQACSILLAAAFFVAAVLAGLSGWLVNSQRYYQESLALAIEGGGKPGHRSNQLKKVQLFCFFALPVFFWLGVFCAGVYILLRTWGIPGDYHRKGYMALTPDEILLGTLWVRIGGLVVSIVGIWLVLRQLRQVRLTILGNAFSNSFSELREIHKIFVEHPDLRPYFFDNEALSRDAETYQKAKSVAEMYLDAFIHMYLLRPRFPAELRNHIDLLIEDMVTRSGFLADYLQENARFMPPALNSQVLRFIKARV